MPRKAIPKTINLGLSPPAPPKKQKRTRRVEERLPMPVGTREPFSRLQRAMKALDLNYTTMAQQLGIPGSSIFGWKKRGTIPLMVALACDALTITAADAAGNEPPAAQKLALICALATSAAEVETVQQFLKFGSVKHWVVQL